MKLMNRLASGAATIALVSVMATAVYAQETTASIRGQIVDETGAAVRNATVTVTHVPTGSAVTSMTGADGFYSTRGLRVGGPYRISAAAADFETGASTLLSAGVGEPAQVNVTLLASGQVEELVVTGGRAAQQTGGPGSSYTAADIQTLPSISRDLKDVVRLDPLVTVDGTNQDAVSFNGTNNRFNQFTVDGVRQNDDFGLNGNGYPTQRSPVSIDWIEAVSASAAPYSVINNGFTGGQINAVTKSGTNEFHGTAFYQRTGKDFRGKKANGVDFSTEFKEEILGLSFGGPIVPDKLFFFVGYEKFNGTLGFDTGPVGSGSAIIIPRISTDALNTFQTAATSIYGYDPGSYVSGGFPVGDKKKFAKVDWNIIDGHRATFTYQKTVGNSFNGSVTSSFANGNSTTQPRVGLSTNQYDKIEALTTYTAQLNSDWTDSFSTELRYNYKEQDTSQNPLGGLSVGQVIVNVADLPGVSAAGGGTPQIQFGADTFRHDNYLNTKVNTFEAIARYHTGPHEFTFGARTEKDEAFNVFVSNSLGSYTFASYNDFVNRRASGFSLTGGVDPSAGTVPATLGTARNGAAEFSYRINSIYGEDRVQVTDTVSVTAGVRGDWYVMSDKPTLNPAFVSRNGFDNQETLDGKSVLLPRVGFTWDTTPDLRISGGIGKFSSTGLNVWLSNAFSNNGVNQTNVSCPAGPYTNVDLTQAPAGCTFTPGSGNTNALAPAFQIPTVWKGNIAAEYRFDLGQFGDGWRVRADYIQQSNDNALYWTDARTQVIGLAPDGRPVYGRNNIGQTTGNDYDFLLANIDKGGSRSYAFTLAKNWDDGVLQGLSAVLTYTNTHATDVSPMTSSIAQSSYTRAATSSANSPARARSDYEIRNKLNLFVGWERMFFGDNKTSMALVAQRRTGLPFSYTFANSRSGNFDNDFGNNVSSYSGRQATSNALLYVPTANDAKVVYATGFDQAAFQTFLQASGLSKYAGGIAPRNAFNNPKVTTVDLHFAQEFPAFPNGSKIEVFMDVENFGNLLNNKWGVIEQYDFYRGVPVVDVSCIGAASTAATSCATPGARYLYRGTGTGGSFQNPVDPYVFPGASLWQITVGARYKF